jgi:hypothetical protein
VVANISDPDAARVAAYALRAEYSRWLRTNGLDLPELLLIAEALMRAADRDVTHNRALSNARSERYRARQREHRAA